MYGFLKNLRFFEPFLLLFFLDKQLLLVQVGILFSIRETVTHLIEIPSGIIADSLGRKNSMVFSFLSYILSFVLFYLGDSFSWFVAAIIFFGAAEAFRSGTHKAMIIEYLKVNSLDKYKVEYYGHTRSAGQYGSALSALIAAGLVFYLQEYRIVFIASIIPYVIDIFLVLSYPAYVDGEKQVFEGTSLFRKCMKQIGTTSFKSIVEIKDRRIIKAIFSSIIFEAIFKTVKDYLQLIIKNYILAFTLIVYVSEKDKYLSLFIGITYFFIYLLTSQAAKMAGAVERKSRSKAQAINYLYFAGCVITLLAGVFYSLKQYNLVILLFVLFYVVFNLRKPLNMAWLTDLVDKKVTATILSIESQFKSLLIIIFAPMLGWIADQFSIGISLIFAAVILLLSAPVALLKRPRV
jgi:MFS family permease